MNKTKKSLLMSAISLLLCISMLIGSTFAWFTDSVSSASNKIQSGTLKVDLELLDKETGEWNSLKESQAPIFNNDKWEPGYVDAKVLKVENEGNLALKWVAKFYSEHQLSILADVIDVYVRPSDSEIGYPADRNLDGYTCVGNLRTFINSIEETTYGTLEAKEVSYLGLALKMREEAGNEYKGLSLGGAFDIRIYATQWTGENESDSFDNQYDKNATFDVLADKSILSSQSKYINDGAESVDFAIFHKGVKIVAVSVPAGAIADKDKPVTVTIRAIDPNVAVSKNTQAYAYDIDVSNLKSDLKGDQLVTVVVAAPKGLASIKAYHKNELLTDAVYDEVAGTITFKTASFSPFEVTAEEVRVEEFEALRNAMQSDGANIVLDKDITINLRKGSTHRSETHKTSSGYYNAVNIVNKDVSLDLNGHGIIVSCGQGYNDNSDVGALFYVGANGSLNIRDNSENKNGYIKMESSIYAVWAPHAEPSYAKIFDGIFIADSYAGDLIGTSTDPDSFDGTMANENSNRALIYAGFGGNINVYGGYFLYNNTPNDIKNRNNGAFNAKDFYNGATPLITIHEGVYLSNKEYRQNPQYTSQPNGDYDNFSVVLSQYGKISETTVNETIKIGKEESTYVWYKVVPNYKYKITFMDEDGTKVLDKVYIWEDDGKVTFSDSVDSKDYTAKSKLTGEYKTDFGGWANAASIEVTEIAANNDTDIILYPTLENKFTVRWLNEDGVVLSSAQVKSGSQYSTVAESEPNDPISKYGDEMQFSHWEIRKANANGAIISENISDTYEITSDISIYPVYNYNGQINLTPHDTDGDGRPNYYTVESATGLSGDVTIPGYVNGVQVAVITDLSGDWLNSGVTSIIIGEGVKEIRSDAFAMTSALAEVTIPSSVTKIGDAAFADPTASGLGGIFGYSKTPVITYNGTREDWDKVVAESNKNGDEWEDGLSEGTTVVCDDGTYTLTKKDGSLLWGYTYTWTWTSKNN